MPEQRDVADMLRRIQTLATQSSLVVKAFRPQAVANKTLHQEWPMALELDGTYHNLARFFDQVSKVPRIINVGGIAIKAKTANETPSTARRSPRSARRRPSCCSTRPRRPRRRPQARQWRPGARGAARARGGQ